MLPVALDQHEAIGHAMFRYSALVFGFGCLLLLFPRQTSLFFRSNMPLLVSLSLASLVNAVHQQYLQKHIEFMPLILYGSNNK